MNNNNDNNSEQAEALDVETPVKENNNDLIGIDDLITKNAELITETIDLSATKNQNYSSVKDVNKSNENEPLNIKHESSEVIQVPPNDVNNSSFLEMENTLNESVVTTIYRDLFLIYTKLKIVLMPYGSKYDKNYHIKQWDLWGPLLLDMILACTLAINSREKSNMIILIFVIFWIGGVIIYLNANFLGVKSSIFQILCLLGYCLFPLNLSAFFVTLLSIKSVLRFIIVLITCLWSIYSSSDFFNQLTNKEQKYLVEYPCILFYLYISWFIISA